MLPGMAADWRMFRHQLAAFPQAFVPTYIPAQPRESMGHYAARLAASLALDGPCIVVGGSFGGMLALELIQHLDARACVLISSVHGPDELPRRARMLTPIGLGCPKLGFRVLKAIAWLMKNAAGPHLSDATIDVLDQLIDCDTDWFAWTCYTILTWQPPATPRVPLYHMHGDKDFVLPMANTQPDAVIEGCGHLTTLQRPEEVNALLRRWLETLANGRSLVAMGVNAKTDKRTPLP